jgi:hypothetical protein
MTQGRLADQEPEMTFAMVYAENGDIVGTYASREAAMRDLVAFVRMHPQLQDEIGLRPYENGRPAGEFQSASVLVGEEALAQPHLQ